MEAYADPLKFYPPDPPNQTDVKETVKQMTSNAKDLKDVNLNNIAGIGEKEFCEMFDAFRTNDTLVRFSAVNCEVYGIAGNTKPDINILEATESFAFPDRSKLSNLLDERF